MHPDDSAIMDNILAAAFPPRDAAPEYDDTLTPAILGARVRAAARAVETAHHLPIPYYYPALDIFETAMWLLDTGDGDRQMEVLFRALRQRHSWLTRDEVWRLLDAWRADALLDWSYVTAADPLEDSVCFLLLEASRESIAVYRERWARTGGPR